MRQSSMMSAFCKYGIYALQHLDEPGNDHMGTYYKPSAVILQMTLTYKGKVTSGV